MKEHSEKVKKQTKDLLHQKDNIFDRSELSLKCERKLDPLVV